MAEREAQATAASARPGAAARLLVRAGELRSKLVSGANELTARAGRGAQKVREAAHDLRRPILQQALAARDRGNLEAAFWLLAEESAARPDDTTVALPYWDLALVLGRVEIASPAGVLLVEAHAASGEPELAAQHWVELVKEAPDALVSTAAIATILPALRARLAAAEQGGQKNKDSGTDDPETFRGLLRKAIRHAVDPRNGDLHPGVALRIFEAGRELDPEAARRAAEAALESPNLHEAKRQRLSNWLAGEPIEETPAPAPAPVVASAGSRRPSSEAEIRASAARLPPSRPLTPPEPAAPTGPSIEAATIRSLDDDAMLLVDSRGERRLAFSDIEAVSVAEILGIEEGPVTLVDLVLNWSRRRAEPLRVVRLRRDQIELEGLVPASAQASSDFSNLLGEILLRSQAIPMPDPESALGTRITCFGSLDLYERSVLRIAA